MIYKELYILQSQSNRIYFEFLFLVFETKKDYITKLTITTAIIIPSTSLCSPKSKTLSQRSMSTSFCNRYRFVVDLLRCSYIDLGKKYIINLFSLYINPFSFANIFPFNSAIILQLKTSKAIKNKTKSMRNCVRRQISNFIAFFCSH